MKKKIRAFREKRRAKKEAAATGLPPDGEIPRITNETVAAHREEVLKGARKYIYPLQHSKHRVVLISASLFIALLLSFMTYAVLALYRFDNTTTFMYHVTQVVPFPAARAGNKFVSYESYMFELRHYMHYYQNQQKLSFDSDAGRQQLADYKKRALDKVVNDAYIKQLAKTNKVTVTDAEVRQQIDVVREQNRLGGSDRVFEDVLKEYWGWTIDDFHRSLKQELLTQKVLSTLDTDTHGRADAALKRIRQGADFAQVAKDTSDDIGTKQSGGDFGIFIDKTNRDVSSETVDALFNLKPGEVSDVLDIGYALEIVKNIEQNGDKIHPAHILFNFKDINEYINNLKDKQKAKLYIKA